MDPYPLQPTLATIPDDKIPGRELEIIHLLRLLRSQSVSVEEMRRMGKTLLLRKLAHLSNNNLLPLEFKDDDFKAKYMSFQGKQNLGEVIDMLLREIRDFKAWYKVDFTRTYNLIKGIVSAPEIDFAGAKFSINMPEYKKSWKDVLFAALEDIATTQQKDNVTLILIFDELPIMLWEWYKEGKYEDAIELLDILRERRQSLEKKGIRFIYCGSIGIKVVLDKFRKEFQYTGEPTNEMEEFDLKPFRREESDFLLQCFLSHKFKVDENEKTECFRVAFELSNGLPFHLSKMFNLIQTEFDYMISVNNIRSSYDIILNDSRHHGAFKQLIDRLDIYYAKEKADNMKKLLNVLSGESDFISEDELHNRTDIDKMENVKDGLYTLLGDHYIVRQLIDGRRTFKFKYEIFKEWWKINIA